MEIFYYLVFGVLSLVVAALELSKTSIDRITTSSAFNSFKNNYLVVYSLMMGMKDLNFSHLIPFWVVVILCKNGSFIAFYDAFSIWVSVRKWVSFCLIINGLNLPCSCVWDFSFIRLGLVGCWNWVLGRLLIFKAWDLGFGGIFCDGLQNVSFLD